MENDKLLNCISDIENYTKNERPKRIAVDNLVFASLLIENIREEMKHDTKGS